MTRVMWLGVASLTLYVISGQRTITEEMGWIAAASVIVILFVVVSFVWPLFLGVNGRTEVKQDIGTINVPRGPLGLFGTGVVTVSQKTTFKGNARDVEKATGSVMPDKPTPTGYASGFDFEISWKTFFLGVFWTLIGLFVLAVVFAVLWLGGL